MATVASPQTSLSPAEMEQRRYAVESTLGSLRIEGIELEGDVKAALDSFANGRIDLDEMSTRIRGYLNSLV
jgi:hypothetical protein